jgi:hypothetical protein
MASELIPPYEPEEQSPVWDYVIDIGETSLRLKWTYRSRQDSWYLSIYTGDDESTPILLGYKMQLTAMLPQMSKYRLPELGTVGTGDFASQPFFGLLDIAGTLEEPGYEDLGRRCQPFASGFAQWVFDLLEAAIDYGLTFDNFTAALGQEEQPVSIEINP